MKLKKIRLLPFCLILLLIPFILGYASLKNKTIEAWLAYWDAQSSLENLKDNFPDKIDRLHLFFYALDENGNIVNAFADQEKYKKIAKNLSNLDIKYSVSITNDIIYSKTVRTLKDPAIVHRVLSDEDSRKKHIQQIIDIAEEVGADDIDIDYEKIKLEDKDSFAKFIKELANILHQQNKTLNVTVQQKTNNIRKSGAGAVDWKEISEYADRITIMCYNYSSKVSNPGPICPPYWLKHIIKFAKSQIPIDKICIALALHGYDWSSEEVNSVNFRKVVDLLKQYPAVLKWDRKNQTPYFKYSKDGVRHQVWFENQNSISEKIELIKRYKINHIAFWHLGILDPSLSESIDLFLK